MVIVYNQLNNLCPKKIESLQYTTALATIDAMKDSIKETFSRELGFESLKDK